MDELIPDLLGEKDLKSAWKHKPFKMILILFLILINCSISILAAGFWDELISGISITDNLKWLIDGLANIGCYIVFFICLILLNIFEFMLIKILTKKRNT